MINNEDLFSIPINSKEISVSLCEQQEEITMSQSQITEISDPLIEKSRSGWIYVSPVKKHKNEQKPVFQSSFLTTSIASRAEKTENNRNFSLLR
jgi:hypothetical protein